MVCTPIFKQVAAFLQGGGASPLRATKKASPFQRQSVVLKPTLIINHSSAESLDKEKKEALILEASKIVAKTLGKPESYVMCSLTESTMSFGGKIGVRRNSLACVSSAQSLCHGIDCSRRPLPSHHTPQPTVFLYLTSIGHIGSDTNPCVGWQAHACLDDAVSTGLPVLNPCLSIHHQSIVDREAAKALTDLVTEKLSIPKNRVFIQFVDSAAANFGWQGNTFG